MQKYYLCLDAFDRLGYEEEKTKIINLYKRSNASIRRFCKFYGSRSYSCVYNVIKEYEEKMKEGTYENKNNNN